MGEDMTGTADTEEMENEIPSLTELLTAIGWGHEVKVSCSVCGQKLDMTDIAPFAVICCPSCASRVVRPVYFGDYVLEEQGRKRDNMTTVFRAFDVKLGRHVAVKILNPEYSIFEEIRSRFTKIAHLLASINHHAIISIYNCGELNGLAYIVSQYAEYGTLKEFLSSHSGPLPPEMAIQWLRDLVSGVQKAFASGISHGEIKPSNILVDSEKRVLLTGFGLYELMREAGICVNDSYTAPEKITEGTIDDKGDIYSLGVLFYRLLTGADPFAGNRKRDSIVPPVKLNKGISRMVSELICRMLSVHPEERPNYVQILDVLDFFLANMEYDKKERKRKISTKLQYDGKMTGIGVTNDGSGSGRKKGMILILSAVILVCLAAVVLLLVLTR